MCIHICTICVYIYIYTLACVYMYTYVYIHTHTYTCPYTCTHDSYMPLRSVFKISCLFLRPRPWQFEI